MRNSHALPAAASLPQRSRNMIHRAELSSIAVCTAAALIAVGSIAQAAPTITNVAPRGLEIGKTTTIVITGSDLSADVQLVSEAKIVGQQVKSGAKPNRVELEVTLDPATPPGLYAVRVADAGGISSPVMLGVDRLPQRAFDSALGQLPAAFSGTVG